ncbi:MAG: helix-turn-helix domain-containing protein [Proteobacteria bacterium]|nr:helix-turn-helix domain-containing protein [Pseudomonadota bacterium]
MASDAPPSEGNDAEFIWHDGRSWGATYVAGAALPHGLARREPGSRFPKLVIPVCGSITVGQAAHHGPFLCSPRRSHIDVGMPKASRAIEVQLRHEHLPALFGIRAIDLDERIVPLCDLSPRRAKEIAATAETTDWPQAFLRLADAVRGTTCRRPDPRLAQAWVRLRENAGQQSISRLAKDLGWSRRTLSTRFSELYGLSPKVVARLFRFERAVDLLREGASLAHVALSSGYFDQAHMHRDFAEFIGKSPGQLQTAEPSRVENLWDAGIPNFQDHVSPQQ